MNIKQAPGDLVNLPNEVHALLALYPKVTEMLESIFYNQGNAYLVGGAVRDLILGLSTHDLDIEVHGLSMKELSKVLGTFGPVSMVGKSFGVLKVHGISIDWSLPRFDSAGRKPEVIIDPHMDIYEALRRRDLTMNAMAIDLKTMKLIDPFLGLPDMQESRLRSPDISFFSDDPLRFYRVMQFIGRFNMFPDEVLQNTCRSMDISGVSKERIEQEFEKLLLKSKNPSLGIRWLLSIDRLNEILPELAKTINIMQDPEWHPEGHVFEHLMQTLDAAARIDTDSKEDKLLLSYASLCHDLGKVSTTIFKNGRWRSPGHAEVGEPLTRSLLKRITRKNKIIDAAGVLVKHHMQPGQFIQLHSTLAAYRRLALRLEGYSSIALLAKLVLADRRGRNGSGHEPLEVYPHFIKTFLTRAKEAQVLTCAEKPLLQGRDIEDLVMPGPLMGRLLKYAYDLQIEEGIKDKDVLRARVLKKLNEGK